MAESTRPVRVRFAPSPTGFLHIGGVRAALYNWLYARHFKGQFLLRIEDTDLDRSEAKFTDDIMASLKWLGLNWDEEPIYQSKRLPVYLERAQELIAAGHAYRCYCTEEEVEAMRTKAMAEGKRPQYDRRCRERKDLSGIGEGARFVIRAKIPLTGHVEFLDLIRGPIRVENTEIDDFVLIRSSGVPTYNLSVVVDDVYSRMTHIIRGDDHINNTPKQIHLYRFFNYDQPAFAHLPMILGPDKKKLSKRHGAVSANAYRADGFLPEALLNFLVRLGWSHGDQEVFTLSEMVEFFSFDHVQKSSAVFNLEKLTWLNGDYLRRTPPERLQGIIADDYSDYFRAGSLERLRTPLGAKLVGLVQQKVKTTKEIAEQLVPLCTPGALEVVAPDLKWGKDGTLIEPLKAAVKRALTELSTKIAASPIHSRHGSADALWGEQSSLHDLGMGPTEIDAYLRQVGEQYGVKLGDLAAPMRLVITGRLVSAGLFELLAILPWDLVSARLSKVDSLA